MHESAARRPGLRLGGHASTRGDGVVATASVGVGAPSRGDSSYAVDAAWSEHGAVAATPALTPPRAAGTN